MKSIRNLKKNMIAFPVVPAVVISVMMSCHLQEEAESGCLSVMMIWPITEEISCGLSSSIYA